MRPDLERMDTMLRAAMELAPDDLRDIAMRHALALPNDPTLVETDESVASMAREVEHLVRRKRS